MRSNAPVELIEEQQKAIDAQDGVWVIIASPGSGKTTVLVRRYIAMLTRGVPFDQMLNLTFTASAAAEMAQRAGIVGAKNVFRTFHSFALDLLKAERHLLPFITCDTIIPVDMQDYTLLFDLVKKYPMINWRELQSRIAGWKCNAVAPDKALEETVEGEVDFVYALAYRDYEKKCREQGWLDFASLMDEALKMLEENEEVRTKYKRKYIAVDEAQDCDKIQLSLLRLIFDGNIFAVGDENQNVYEWRGSQHNNLTNFSQVFPGAKTLYLGTNHRSSKNIVDFLKEILPVDNGLASHMTTYNDKGADFTLTYFDNEDAEAEGVLSRVKDPLHTAIIARTNRQLFIYQRLLAMRGVKYNFLGKKDFWEQNEIKKLLAYAALSRNLNAPANEALARIIAERDMISVYGKVGRDNPMESSPVENLTGIVKIAANKGSLREFLDYARKITHARKSTKALTLSTVHQSKGREYDIVFLIGARQGTMPHSRGEGPEEHRIFFVACSRAALELHISFYDKLSQYLLNYEDRVIDTTFEGVPQ